MFATGNYCHNGCVKFSTKVDYKKGGRQGRLSGFVCWQASYFGRTVCNILGGILGQVAFLSVSLMLLAGVQCPPPAPEQVLADAALYTVKIQVQNDIAFNQDDFGARSGTGFLIDRELGWVLTNAHVATRSPSVVKVSFKGGDMIEARRLHVDPLIDLAILQIAPQSIPETAKEAVLDCDSVPVSGTSVMAYGHPWGLSFTASRGIVSGLAWIYPNQMIQTDAAINSGNSGGPLISLADGRVIGINTSTYQPDEKDGSATAISLAEPMPPVCHIIDLLKAGKDTRLRMLPISAAVSGDDLRPRVAKAFVPSQGFLSGDVITMVNEQTVKTFPELLSKLRGVTGQALVTVDRKGELIGVMSPLRIVPDPLKVRSINLSGLVIAEPWRIDDFEVNQEANLIVDWYESGEEAALSDAKLSDYIVSIDGREFNQLHVLYRYLESLPSDAVIEIMLKRASSASEFFREYRHIRLNRTKLEWLTAQ